MSVERQIERLVALQASEWFEALHTRGEKEYPAFVQWLCQSPQHMAAYLEVVAVTLETRRIDLKGQHDPQLLLAQISPQVSELRALNRPLMTEVTPAAGSSRWRYALATAATIFACLILPLRDTAPSWQDYATSAGEQRVIDLPDGSVVRINAQSLVRIQYGVRAREIWLRRGEALFQVAHDPQRPFSVHTRDALVRALGTQFNVATRASGTTVAVLEGKVQVSLEKEAKPEVARSLTTAVSHAPKTPLAIGAGEAVHVDDARGIERDLRIEVAAAAAWTHKRLSFKRTALEDIVAEINRYNPALQFQLEGIQPGSRHYTGTFDAYEPESLAAFLAREDDIVIERREHQIVIRESDQSSSMR